MALMLQNLTARGSTGVTQSGASLESFLNDFATLLERVPHKVILIPKPLPLTLTTAEGDNGDIWEFSLTSPEIGLSFNPTPRISHAALKANVNYTLHHFQVSAPFFSIIQRKCQLETCCGRNGPLMVLPPALCRRVAASLSVPERERAPNAIEQLKCLLFDGLLEQGMEESYAGRSKFSGLSEELLRFQ